MRNPFRITPYHRRPRRDRKRVFIRVKNDIRRAAPVLGGRFYTPDYLHGENAWADVFFLAERRNQCFFNATLSTARHELAEKADMLAFERALELREYRSPRFEAANDSGHRLMVPDPSESEPHAVFDGLTRREWVARERHRIIAEGEVTVREHIELDHGYAAGIGVHAVLDVPAITVAVIEGFIDRFRANGERGWQGRLIPIAAEEIGEWDHFVANAIVDPLEHPPAEQAHPTPGFGLRDSDKQVPACQSQASGEVGSGS